MTNTNTNTNAGVQTQKDWSKMTVKERRAERLEKHYNSLEKLYNLCGGGKLTGRKLSYKLLVLLQRAHRLTTAQCNGEGNYEAQESELNKIESEVKALFNDNLNGFFINGDPRGYALKLDNSKKNCVDYKAAGLHTDFGGYGILAPEIDGKY